MSQLYVGVYIKDAEWIAELLAHGLLKASFIPPNDQREL
jgi:transposase